MSRLNLISKQDKKKEYFGINLPPEQKLFINRHLDNLKELCPSSAKLQLSFETKNGQIKGKLKINSFSENFYSNKIATTPLEAFILLKEDIEAQLLDWKRKRFSTSLFNQFSPDIKKNINCA